MLIKSKALDSNLNFEKNKVFKILLVEDNPAYVQLFKVLLKSIQVPYETYEVADGEAATKFIFEEVGNGMASVPDLIFLDLNLPKKDGKTVLKELKSKEGFRVIPIIILTTSDNQDDIDDCYGLSANCFLTKPSDITELKNLIKQIETFWLRSVKLPKLTIQSKAV